MLSETLRQLLNDPYDGMDRSLRKDFVNLLDILNDQLGSIFNIDSGDRSLRISNIHIDMPNDIFDYNAQKDAKFKNLSFTAPIKADFEITDRTGKVLAKSANKLITRIPLPTGRGTFIVDGKEYAIRRQMRLKPGVYTTEVEDGIQAFINTAARQSMKIRFNTEDSKFELHIANRKFPVYPLLRGLGISDEAMRQAWGDGLYNKNAIRQTDRIQDIVERFHSTLYKFGSNAESYEEKVNEVHDALAASELDPWTTKITIGRSYDHISPALLLDSTRKMLGVSSGAVKPDKRDALYFKSVLGIDDMIEFALNKSAPKIRNKVAFRLSDHNKDISSILSRPLTNFDSLVKSKFNVSDLSYTPDQLNPLDMFNTLQEITLMGEGGIGDTHSIPLSTRALDDSFMGFIDPVQTPTNNKIGVNMILTTPTHKRGQELVTFVGEPGKVKRIEKSPVELYDKYVALPEEYKYGQKGFSPRSTKVNAIHKGEIVKVDSSKIDYVFPGAAWTQGYATNIIPLINHNSPARITFSTKQISAAIPLVDPEAPLVRNMIKSSKKDGDTDVNRTINNLFSVRASTRRLPKGGTVTKIEDGKIYVRPTGGGKLQVINYYQNFPLNSYVYLDYTPTVQVGDKVKPGEVIASSNFAKDLDFAMGRNLKIAYMPWKGMNFKDGLVVSESAAQKLTSMHLHQNEWSVNRGDIVNKAKFISHYPALYSRDQLSKVDSDGIIKEGVEVFEGDPLMLKMSERRLTEDDIIRGRISSVFKNPYGKDDKIWENKYVGKVDRVIKGKNFVKVYIKTTEPLTKGDKLCYTEDHEVLTKNGWKFVADIKIDDEIASLNPNNHTLEYISIASIHTYPCVDEDTYQVETTQVSMAVTMQHKLYAKTRYSNKHQLIEANKLIGKRYKLKTDAKWDGVDQLTVTLDGNKYINRNREIKGIELDTDCYLTILGAYLSEGSSFSNDGTYGIHISQFKPMNLDLLKQVLDKNNIRYTTRDGFRIYGKVWYEHFHKLGLCFEKYIPEWIFSLPTNRLEVLYKWLMWGGGHKDICYTTTSKKLANDFQRLLLHIGKSGIIKVAPARNGVIKGKEYCFRERYDVRITTTKTNPTINHGHTKTQSGQLESVEKYTGNVYGITLIKNNILYTRRDGKCHWSGNSGLFGQKGVISNIVPDDEMPRTADGEVIEIIQNPTAVMSRMNIGQILETSAGKISKATGLPFYVRNYIDDTSAQSIHKKLKDLGVKPESVLYDKEGNVIADGVPIFEGYQHFMKLKQQSKKYLQHRNETDSYDIISKRPIRGPKLGPLGFYALLAHGATGLLKEMGGLKSELNDNWWRAFETGQPLPKPKTTFAFDKLTHFLTAAGMAIRSEQDGIRIMPLTDADVDNLSRGEILDPGLSIKIGDPAKGDFLKPFDGGLYDRRITGGPQGESWGHITLAEPIPNPLFETAIKKILSITQEDYDSVISGKRGFLDGKIIKVTPNNMHDIKTGGLGIKAMLETIDRDAMLAEVKKEAIKSRGQKRDQAFSKVKYLQGLKIANLQPKDYIISKIPVLPPAFRPVYMTRAGDLRVSDFTSLYQDLGKINNTLKASQGLPTSVLTQLRSDLYDAVKTVQGVGNTANYDSGRQPSGILKFLKGDVPAWGHFQKQIFGKRASIGGRAVIMANPKLGIDEAGIPEEMAWTIFRPHLMRELTATGLNALQADQMIEKRVPSASMALDRVMNKIPVILGRDPKLHKFNTMAFKAHRVKSDAIHIPPLICTGFNADFDGDAMSVNVPVTEEAISDAVNRMLPSQNLIKYGRDTVIVAPEEESIAGLFAGTRIDRNTQKKFPSFAAALQAFKDNEIKLTDGIHVNNIETTPGRILINEQLPEEYRDYSAVWNWNTLESKLEDLAKNDPSAYVPFVQNVKDIGDNFGYLKGLSFTLKDFYKLDTSELNQWHKMEMPTGAVDKKINEKVHDAAKNSVMAVLADSGARGKWDNIRQVLYSPIFASDVSGDIIPHMMRTGFAGGMNWLDYWTIMKGSRSGLQASSLEVSDPGYFGKELTRATMGLTIMPGDSMEVEGLDYPISHPTVLNRYLAQDVKGPGGEILARAGDPVTQELVEAGRKAKIATINVRSPLTSKALSGLYAKDFGRLPDNKKLEIGTDAGIISAQTLTEPAVQLVLRARHGGGAAGQKGTIQGLYAIWPLLSGRAPTGSKALLAPEDGVVEAVERLKSGVYRISVKGGKEFLTPSALPLMTKVGDRFTRGQQLQNGYPDPKELLELNGLRALQKYLVDQVELNYGKTAPDRRYIETLISGLTKYAEIQDPGDTDAFMPGDIIPIPEIEDFIKKNDIKIKYKPIFTGMSMFMPKIEGDWVTKMTGRDMIRQLQESAATSSLSKLRGPKPIMPFIYNMSFADSIDTEGIY